jgi:hypothetical protein
VGRRHLKDDPAASLESSQAVFLVNFVDSVRTYILLKFSPREREISHKVHPVHKIASDGTPSSQYGQSQTALSLPAENHRL